MKYLLYFLPFILYLFPYEGKAQLSNEELFADSYQWLSDSLHDDDWSKTLADWIKKWQK